MTKQYDLVVLGGGLGGYIGAIRAAQLGMRVALVEADKVGGTCLHKGCIPTKALLKTASVYRNIQRANEFGFQLEIKHFDFTQAQKRKDETIVKLHQGVEALLQKHQITVYRGFGRILGPSIFSPQPGTISVEHRSGKENTMLVPKFVLIATGSKPKMLANVTIDHETIVTSDDLVHLEKLPASIIIVGGGIIGVEWASILHDLGVEVTIIESAPNILMTEDKEIRTTFENLLLKRGIQVLTNSTLITDSITKNAHTISLKVIQGKQEKTLESEKMLIAIGREANIDDIGLQNTNISTENHYIQTNEMYQTKESHIYAVGDCIGGVQLAHVAAREAIIAVEHMAGQNPEPLQQKHIPSAIYTNPEIARIGLTEEAAKEQGYSIKIGKFPFQAIGKAHIEGESTGFMKMVVDERTDDILGIHIIGPNATELIAEASLAQFLDASVWEVANTIHPHPSLAEIFQETALATDNKQFHR